jgi:hypothetical protein
MSKSFVLAALSLIVLFASGCAASGEEKNYKELEGQDREPFETEPDPFFGARPATAIYASLDEPPDQVTITTSQPIQAQLDPAAPSLRGLDREHWPLTAFTPANGQTVHNPTYFTDPEVDLGVLALPMSPNVADRMTEALAGHEAQTFSATNFAYLFLEPLQTAAEMGLLPLNMIVQPPLSKTLTP